MYNGEELVVLSPFGGFSELVRLICSEKDENVAVVDAYGRKAIQIAKDLMSKGCKAILTRKYTASLIKNYVSIPIVVVDITPSDLFFHIYRIINVHRRKINKIGFIGFWEEEKEYDFTLYEKILDVKISSFPYHSKEDVFDQVKKAYQEKVNVVFTTGICISKMCESLGLESYVSYPSKTSILYSIQRAKEILYVRKCDIERNQQLKTVINAVSDGVLVIDSVGQVVMLNSQVERIFDVVPNLMIGKKISEIEPQFEVLLSAEYIENKIVDIGQHNLVMRKLPLKATENLNGSIVILKNVSEIQKLEQKIRKETWEKGLRAKFTFHDIIGSSKEIKATISKAEKFAKSNSTILIIGESGTGKELFAQAIHNASSRGNGPFVAVNCAAFPESLLESEFFGYDKGAFTGADKNGKPGLFELAHKGTLFLDEISDLPFSLQAKLLRVLQEREVRRISGDKIIPVDLRILAATNKDLVREVKRGNFREDLFYRLDVLSFRIPPLRERKEDINELIEFFLEKYQKKEVKKVPFISEEIVSRLKLYQWPGNVRELESFIEKYVLLYEKETNIQELCMQMLSNKFSQENVMSIDDDPEIINVRLGTLDEIEYQILVQLIQKYKMNKGKVANILGISRTTLWKKLKYV